MGEERLQAFNACAVGAATLRLQPPEAEWVKGVKAFNPIYIIRVTSIVSLANHPLRTPHATRLPFATRHSTLNPPHPSPFTPASAIATHEIEKVSKHESFPACLFHILPAWGTSSQRSAGRRASWRARLSWPEDCRRRL